MTTKPRKTATRRTSRPATPPTVPIPASDLQALTQGPNDTLAAPREIVRYDVLLDEERYREAVDEEQAIEAVQAIRRAYGDQRNAVMVPHRWVLADQ